MTEFRNQRLAYLERALRDLGLRRQEAHDRATLIYASYVGFWRLVAADPDWEYNDTRPLHRIAEHIKATLIPPADAAPGGGDTTAPRPRRRPNVGPASPHAGRRADRVTKPADMEVLLEEYEVARQFIRSLYEESVTLSDGEVGGDFGSDSVNLPRVDGRPTVGTSPMSVPCTILVMM